MLPQINWAHRIPPLPLFTEINEPATTAPTPPPRCSNCLNSALLPRFHNIWFISQKAINSMIISNVSTEQSAFTPLKLCPRCTTQQNLEHYGLAMVHPVTGKHITSYCKLMQDPATSENWMTAFGKDFGGMSQGNNKTGTKGTYGMFVMNPKGVPNI
jgi:hypothetical protein